MNGWVWSSSSIEFWDFLGFVQYLDLRWYKRCSLCCSPFNLCRISKPYTSKWELDCIRSFSLYNEPPSRFNGAWESFHKIHPILVRLEGTLVSSFISPFLHHRESQSPFYLQHQQGNQFMRNINTYILLRWNASTHCCSIHTHMSNISHLSHLIKPKVLVERRYTQRPFREGIFQCARSLSNVRRHRGWMFDSTWLCWSQAGRQVTRGFGLLDLVRGNRFSAERHL